MIFIIYYLMVDININILTLFFLSTFFKRKINEQFRLENISALTHEFYLGQFKEKKLLLKLSYKRHELNLLSF